MKIPVFSFFYNFSINSFQTTVVWLKTAQKTKSQTVEFKLCSRSIAVDVDSKSQPGNLADWTKSDVECAKVVVVGALIQFTR